MLAKEYGWDIESILDMRISVLSKLSDSIKDRKDAQFLQNTLIAEWQVRTTISVIASAAQDESGKFAKEVGKIRFPWEEFGFPEVLGKTEKDFDPDDLSYLETGDLSAADRNAGKALQSFFGGGPM